MSDPLRVLSLGAGVQSTALLLMGIHGEFGDRPDVAIFADTGWEPAGVYRHLAWLEQFAASIGFSIIRIGGRNIKEECLTRIETDGTFPGMPFFAKDATGKGSMLKRQCTREYKIRPIRRMVRQLTGGKPTEQWVGISLDEWQRVRESDVQWITNRYPLVDNKLTRNDCLLWLGRHGYPRPPKSSCIGCPFHDNRHWREMKTDDPAGFSEAIAFDAAVRHLPRVTGEVFLHRSLKPLSEVYLGEDQPDLWGQECGGHCGV